MDTNTLLSDIKKELRAHMNGPRSQYMREHGLDYHIIFGVDLPCLQQIAREFPQDYTLAQRLWSENVRESKILATLLMPPNLFDRPTAELWADQFPCDEIVRMAAMNLLSRLPYAPSLAFEWVAGEHRGRRLAGFLVAAHLLARGAVLHPRAEAELRDHAACALAEADDTALAAAARAVLHHMPDPHTP